MQGLGTEPVLGEKEIFLVYIGLDDYPKLKKNKFLFNMLLRRCGGMPVKGFDTTKYCSQIAFTSNLYREDFAREMERQIGVLPVIEFRRVYVDRKHLPPVESYDKTDFNRLSKVAVENRKREKDKNQEPDYYYPTGKQV